MKSTQTWQDRPYFYVSNGSAYSPAVFSQAARKLSRTVAGFLSAAIEPQVPAPTEDQYCRKTIDPLTGLTIPQKFY